MDILFMGTPEPATKCLKALIDAGENMVGVVTQPDKPKGRGLKLSVSPVKELAQQKKLKILQPEKAKDRIFISEIRLLAPELIVVVAYGKILPKEILDIPKHGCFNVHASLLPKYRGAAPIQWAIMNGEKETGISIFKLQESLDTGDVLLQKKVPIDDNDTSTTLSIKLFDEAAKLLIESLKTLKSDNVKMIKQNDKEATYAPTLKKELGVIDWKQTAKKIYDKIRALDQWPGAYTYYMGKILKILRCEMRDARWEMGMKCEPGKILDIIKGKGFVVGACDGSMLITEVQPEAGKRMPAYQFAIGHGIKAGESLPS